MTRLAQMAPAVTVTAPAADVEVDFGIVRAAVNIARLEQGCTLWHLKGRLANSFPEATEAAINVALKYWGDQIVRTEGRFN